MKTEKTVTRDSLRSMLSEMRKVEKFYAEANNHLSNAIKEKSAMTDFFRTAVNSSRADLEFNQNSFGRKISGLLAKLSFDDLEKLIATLPIAEK